MAIGDFTVNMGQGLIQWQSLAFEKSPEVMAIKRQAPVLVPYRSAGEFYFNRGIGITLQAGKLETTLFASYKKISGNMVKDTPVHFTSMLTSGYYRTSSEIADRNRIALTSFGGNISYQLSSLKLGFNTVLHHFDIPLQKRDEPYNLYAISGKKIFNSSIDYSYTYKNLHLFGEFASDQNFHKAFVNGALISVDPKVDLSIFYRNIQKQYKSLFGNAFTENTTPVNEKGIYAGVLIRPTPGWQLNAYADVFHFPWIKYLVNAPTRGYDYLAQLNYQPNKRFGVYVRFRNQNKPTDSSGNGMIYFPQNQMKQNFRIHLFQQLTTKFSVNSRAEVIWFNHQLKSSEQGFLSYVEGRYDWKRFSANLRLQYFETNGYDSRVYVYESDVLYSYSIPAFYDKGFRSSDQNFHKAFVNGALISVDPKVDLSIFYRNIQKQYKSLFGNAFTENTTPVNEKGIYAGVLIRPTPGWQLNAYADVFHFPWIKYLVNAPTRGYDYLAQLNYQPNKRFGVYVRFRNQNKPTDSSGNGMIYFPQNQMKQNFRIHLFQQLTTKFSVNSRAEVIWFNHQLKSSEQGFLSYVEGRYDWKRFSANLRLQYFETNGYDSRVYVYESDVLYSYSIPAFYDKGFRYYFNIHGHLTNKLQCWLRLAQTVYTNKKIFGSGLDEIIGNRKSEAKAQFLYIF